jgi:glycine cleavage system H lipoate-binding protein
VESVKAASDIYAPLSGTVTEVNENLTSNPALLNTDAFGEGWMFKMKLSAPSELEALLSPILNKTHRRNHTYYHHLLTEELRGLHRELPLTPQQN